MPATKKRILDDATFKAQMETQNRLLAGIQKAIAGEGGSLDVDNIVEFARYLGAGLGQICNIGKQFQVPKESAVTISTDKQEGSTLTATIDADAFIAAMGTVLEKEFVAHRDGTVWYNEAGEPLILSDYGITTSGTPVSGDKIIILETAPAQAWDLMQYNPEGYAYPYDTSGKGDYAYMMAHKIHSYGSVPFCPVKLMYYTEAGMPAGRYKFTLYKARYGSGGEYDGDYVFTLTQSIPAYGGFRIPGLGGYQSSYNKADVTSKTVSTYGAKYNNATHPNTFDGRGSHIRCTTIETDITIAEYDSQAYDYDLGTFTAQRADYYTEVDTGNPSFVGKRCRVEQQCYGDNRFSHSVFRIWGNSTAKAATGDGLGNWFFYRDDFDTAPSAAVCNLAGYLHGYGQDFLDSIQTVKVKCALPAYYSPNYVASYEEVECKIFQASYTEVNGGAAVSGQPEGAKLEYFVLHSTADDRKKLYGSSYNYWFLRSPYSGYSNNVWLVYTTGTLNSGTARGAYGFVPACIIKKSA